MDHYERLGVAPTASRDEIRIAYRELIRRHHPDAHAGAPTGSAATGGREPSTALTQINEAWRVLSDPQRRARYDGQRDVDTAAAAAPNPRVADASGPAADTTTIARPTLAQFPWRMMLLIIAVGITFVLVTAALADPAQTPPPDNVMQVGSCVDIENNGDAREVLCDGANDGVVDTLIDDDTTICPPGTDRRRDRQGMYEVCVRMRSPG